jgi:hypothetical protein
LGVGKPVIASQHPKGLKAFKLVKKKVFPKFTGLEKPLLGALKTEMRAT